MKIPFDKVYCVSYCRNIERQNNIRKVMKYLGISFEFIYGADYRNLKILKDEDFEFIGNGNEIRNGDFSGYAHFLGSTYNHYTAIMHAYESGANSVLILEDDCEFINDMSYINWALNNYPKDADYVMFGYADAYHFHNKNGYINTVKSVNKKFVCAGEEPGISAAGEQLYGICNRKTMEEYLNLQKNKLTMVDDIPFILFRQKKYKVVITVKAVSIDKNVSYFYNQNERNILYGLNV